MPRRGRSASPSRSYSAPARAAPPRAVAPPQRSNVPAAAPPAAPAPMMAQPQQPGMFAQMATTAAGVAVGSAIGHTIGHALTGGGGGGGGNNETQAADPQQPQQQYAPPTQPAQGICSFELKQFLECAQTQHDLTLCDGFNDVLKQCKQGNGLM